MSLSLMSMYSYFACGNICASVLTLPFSPSFSGHGTTRIFRCGKLLLQPRDQLEGRLVRIAHTEQQLVLR